MVDGRSGWGAVLKSPVHQGDSVVLDHEIVTGRGPERPDPWDVGFVRYDVENGVIKRVELP